MEKVTNPAPRRLTQRYVERLQPWPRAYAVRDTEVRGLMAVVQPSGRVSWHVQADAYEPTPDGGLRLVGTRRRKIGEPALMDVSVARRKAREAIAALRRPQPARHASSMTLGEAWDMYVAERRRKGRAPRTIANVEGIAKTYLADWRERQLQDVFQDRLGMVRLHERLSARGPVQVNRVFRALRAVLRRSRRLDPTLPPPPTEAVEQNSERRRSERAMTEKEISAWARQVHNLTNEVRSDAHLFALLSGLRTGADGARGGGVGVVSLRWEHVDWERRLIRLPKSKTGQPLIIPLSTQMVELLERRRDRNIMSPFVFPADSRTGHIVSLREKSLSHFGHDCRATFITHGEVAGVPRELVKRLVGHADNTVTGGDVNAEAQVEFLRSAQQLISDYLEKLIHEQLDSVPAPQAA
jgi:integrase